jgi:hypothetical protein
LKWAFAIGAFRVAVVVNRGAIVACRRAQAATDATGRASSGCEAHLHGEWFAIGVGGDK